MYEDIPLKCMADILVVDHDNMIVQPVDLKTTSYPEYLFYKSFIKWRYWIQAQLYWYIIRQNMDADETYRKYKLLDFQFAVVNRFEPNALVWTYADTTATEDLVYGKFCKLLCRNWRNIIKDLYRCIEENRKLPIGIKSNNDIVEWLNKE